MFAHEDGSPWKASERARPMAAATDRAKLKAVTLHALRHSWASLAAMNGVPMAIIAANLGHVGTRTTEKHYAHLSPSRVRDAIRAGATKYGIRSNNKIVPIRSQPALCDRRSVTIIWRWRRRDAVHRASDSP
jgi:hypothetical protein